MRDGKAMFKVGEESGDKEILIKAYKKMFRIGKGGFTLLQKPAEY